MTDRTNIAPPCPTCTCTQPHPAHALLAALRDDELDAALTLGLLDAEPCPACATGCAIGLTEARDARRFALAARERFRTRTARLERIKAERDAARRAVPASRPAAPLDRGTGAAAGPTPPRAPHVAPALPAAAADALARALAKAKARHA